MAPGALVWQPSLRRFFIITTAIRGSIFKVIGSWLIIEHFFIFSMKTSPYKVNRRAKWLKNGQKSYAWKHLGEDEQ
jgi:hypothetical protein